MTEINTKLEMHHNIKCVMLDLDGTIYLGNRPFDFTCDFLSRLDRIGIRHMFLTNNSSKSVDEYVEKFKKIGIPARREDILTSTLAAAGYINHSEYRAKRAFVMASDGVKAELSSLGINVVEDDPEILIAAFDLTLTYETLTKFTNFVAMGLPYIATHPDRVCPREAGFYPDLGSFIELIHACTDRYPDVICGKPSEQMLAVAEHTAGMSRENLLMVGDRLTTDIAIGRYGVRTALVLSGEAKLSDAGCAPFAPTYIFNSIKELGEALELGI